MEVMTTLVSGPLAPAPATARRPSTSPRGTSRFWKASQQRTSGAARAIRRATRGELTALHGLRKRLDWPPPRDGVRLRIPVDGGGVVACPVLASDGGGNLGKHGERHGEG